VSRVRCPSCGETWLADCECGADALRARLAEVERERDEARSRVDIAHEGTENAWRDAEKEHGEATRLREENRRLAELALEAHRLLVAVRQITISTNESWYWDAKEKWLARWSAVREEGKP
jgi:hypothetical protein